MINIKNRRYIGNKSSMLSNIVKCLEEIEYSKDYVVADLFAGTGVVAYEFANMGNPVIVNDLLYSNYVSYKAWFSNENIDIDKLNNILSKYNSLNYEEIDENYFSDIYANKYFSLNDAKKIGYIRDDIEFIKENINEREYYILLTSLLYAADKIANTVGHFEAYLKKTPTDSNFKLSMLDIKNLKNCLVYSEDANTLAKSIKADIVYLDPPYNARQYVNFYHVLENLARWNKPTEFEGNSMKFKRDELKSGYSRSKAPLLFKDLIDSLDCKIIIVSYNNTYSAKSTASNNKIQEQEIIDILESKGKVTKKEYNYKFFNTGKTDFKEHKEFIFICEVRQ